MKYFFSYNCSLFNVGNHYNDSSHHSFNQEMVVGKMCNSWATHGQGIPRRSTAAAPKPRILTRTTEHCPTDGDALTTIFQQCTFFHHKYTRDGGDGGGASRAPNKTFMCKKAQLVQNERSVVLIPCIYAFVKCFCN